MGRFNGMEYTVVYFIFVKDPALHLINYGSSRWCLSELGVWKKNCWASIKSDVN